MNLEEFFTPAFVVTVILAYLMPKLSPYIDRTLSSLKRLLIRTLPLAIQGYIRSRRLKALMQLKNDRRNNAAINYQISKSNSAFIMFVGVIFIYILLIILGPFRSLLTTSVWFGILATIPIYIFEIFWLIQDIRAKKLVDHASKIRVKNLTNTRPVVAGRP